MVLIAIFASCGIGQARSQCVPSTDALIAFFARPGAMEAATSAGVTPAGKLRFAPSGKVSVTSAIAALLVGSAPTDAPGCGWRLVA